MTVARRVGIAWGVFTGVFLILLAVVFVILSFKLTKVLPYELHHRIRLVPVHGHCTNDEPSQQDAWPC